MEPTVAHSSATGTAQGDSARAWEPVDSGEEQTDDSQNEDADDKPSQQGTHDTSNDKAPKSDAAEDKNSESSADERPSRSTSRRHLHQGENRPQHQSQPPPLVKRRPGQRIQLVRNQSTSSAHTLATLAAVNAAGAGGAAPTTHEHNIHHRKKQFVAHTGSRLGGHAKRAVSKGSRTNLAGGGTGGEKRRSAVFQPGPLGLQRTASSNSAASNSDRSDREKTEQKPEEKGRQRGFIVGSAEDTDLESHHAHAQPELHREQTPPPEPKPDKGKQPLVIDTKMPAQREVRETPAPAMLPLHNPPLAAGPQVTTTIAKGQHVTPLHHQSSTSTLATTTPPLTSHFLESPSGTSHRSSSSPQKRPGVQRTTSTASNFGLGRDSSSLSQTSTVPLRTQQKLWLQRQSSQLSPPQYAIAPTASAAPTAQPALNTPLQSTPQTPAFYAPILERTMRDYFNVRRYRDPVGEGITRVLNSKKFMGAGHKSSGSNERNEAQLGLSQSLKDAESRRNKNWERAKARGSMDDSEIKRGESEEEMLCRRMWGEGELLVSHE